jgi:ectoine hydroxylase-related dioxygenase (phytanoyl-CoA dioxygenase family)
LWGSTCIIAHSLCHPAHSLCHPAHSLCHPAHPLCHPAPPLYRPWHQDRWQHIDRDPLLTVYTAIDPAGIENGCVQIIPRSHLAGVINPAHHSAFLTEEQAATCCPDDKVINLDLKAGG